MVRFSVMAMVTAAVTAEPTNAAAVDELAGSIGQRVNVVTAPLLKTGAVPRAIAAYRDRVRTANWSEVWPGPDGTTQTRDVTGELWTAAIQAALDQHHSVFLPARSEPYYLDGPIVLRSGCRLLADPQAKIRLKPGANTCMVRNEHVAGFQDRPVPADPQPDTDILVQGGIWTTLATTRAESNGNHRGRADDADSVPGCHGRYTPQHSLRAPHLQSPRQDPGSCRHGRAHRA